MITLRKSLLSSAALTMLFCGMLASGHKVQAATTVSAGDLIRGTSLPAVYYMGRDGFRYVFPNEKTYKTWFHTASGAADFSKVKTISDSELAAIQMGGNVTYKPGSRMIKIDSDAKTYYVGVGGSLYWVEDEATAISLYGSSWNKMIDDVPDGFFPNYTQTDYSVGDSEVDAVEALSASYSINDDKGLIEPEYISVTDSGYSPTSVEVCVGQTVTFTNNGSDKHTVTADDLSWGSGTMTAGTKFTRRFTEKDTVTFYDGYDSMNTGAIYVENCN